MFDLKNKLELHAPFLSHNWLYLLSIGVAFFVASFLKRYLSKPRDGAIVLQDSIEDLGFDPGNESEGKHILYKHTNKMSEAEMMKKAQDFYNFMNERRSVRFISKETVPSLDLIKTIIHTAGTAPSGAHMQPWTFVVVSNAKVKNIATLYFMNFIYRINHVGYCLHDVGC